MRIHCKVVVIAVCLGVFLLLYFLGGNAADDPLLKEVVEEEEEEDSNSSPSSSELGRDVAAKFARKPPAGLGVRAEELLKGRKERKAINRGASVNAKSKLRSNVGRPVTRRTRAEEVMHLAVVACGNRLDETLTLVKSALLFSLKKIKFHIFAEDPLAPQFEERLNQWPRPVLAKFQYSIYPITFSVGNADEWKKLFKPCAAQRLFLPVILKDVDSLLYVDTDVLFLRPMDDIWSLLKSFNSTQLAAMAPRARGPQDWLVQPLCTPPFLRGHRGQLWCHADESHKDPSHSVQKQYDTQWSVVGGSTTSTLPEVQEPHHLGRPGPPQHHLPLQPRVSLHLSLPVELQA